MGERSGVEMEFQDRSESPSGGSGDSWRMKQMRQTNEASVATNPLFLDQAYRMHALNQYLNLSEAILDGFKSLVWLSAKDGSGS